jgi:hypothetical protein
VFIGLEHYTNILYLHYDIHYTFTVLKLYGRFLNGDLSGSFVMSIIYAIHRRYPFFFIPDYDDFYFFSELVPYNIYYDNKSSRREWLPVFSAHERLHTLCSRTDYKLARRGEFGPVVAVVCVCDSIQSVVGRATPQLRQP